MATGINILNSNNNMITKMAQPLNNNWIAHQFNTSIFFKILLQQLKTLIIQWLTDDSIAQ